VRLHADIQMHRFIMVETIMGRRRVSIALNAIARSGEQTCAKLRWRERELGAR
jgi:hypothetical protein